jgi:putative RNA 2'-phosphotransferase
MMVPVNAERAKRLSKFLSFVLRHQPEAAGLTLDESGWANVDAVLLGARSQGLAMTMDELRYVVETSDKRRFALSADERCIRAQQGHSIEVDLDLPPSTPPEFLYHGTVARFLPAIMAEGLKKGARHHVHLAADRATAEGVGARRGAPVVLCVQAEVMHREGHAFFLSGNGVWLTETVPPIFLSPVPS